MPLQTRQTPERAPPSQLRDNLEVFHELKGPVFPASAPGGRAVRRGIVIPPGLPQAPGIGLEGAIGGFRLPAADGV